MSICRVCVEMLNARSNVAQRQSEMPRYETGVFSLWSDFSFPVFSPILERTWLERDLLLIIDRELSREEAIGMVGIVF